MRYPLGRAMGPRNKSGEGEKMGETSSRTSNATLSGA
jgi:hypothetical protein